MSVHGNGPGRDASGPLDGFATHPVRPKPGAVVVKTLVVLVLSGWVSLAVFGGGLVDEFRVLTGGVHGNVWGTQCVKSGRNTHCFGVFVSTGPGPRLVRDVEVDGGEPNGSAHIAASLGSPTSKTAYADSERPMRLADMMLGSWAFVGLAAVLVAWPLRALIHLRRPDVWPIWLGPKSAYSSRAPRWVRAGTRLIKAWAWLTAAVVAICLVLSFGVPGAVPVAVAVAGVVTWQVRRRRTLSGR